MDGIVVDLRNKTYDYAKDMTAFTEKGWSTLKWELSIEKKYESTKIPDKKYIYRGNYNR